MQVLALQQLDEWLVQGVKQSKLGKMSNYGKIEAIIPAKWKIQKNYLQKKKAKKNWTSLRNPEQSKQGVLWKKIILILSFEFVGYESTQNLMLIANYS